MDLLNRKTRLYDCSISVKESRHRKLPGGTESGDKTLYGPYR